jgi:hypothetical protein
MRTIYTPTPMLPVDDRPVRDPLPPDPLVTRDEICRSFKWTDQQWEAAQTLGFPGQPAHLFDSRTGRRTVKWRQPIVRQWAEDLKRLAAATRL